MIVPSPARAARLALALSLAAGALASAASAPSAGAQAASVAKVPRRPKLAPAADTNDALAYYQYGMNVVRRRPEDAADAFYWASRIAPAWGEPYYARRVALLLAKGKELPAYLDEVKWTKDEMRQLDSLDYAARRRNPFLFRTLDEPLIEAYVRLASDADEDGLFFLGRRTGDPAYDGQVAYLRGNHREATRLLREASRRYPKRFSLHEVRARAFYGLQEYDSAATELSTYLERLRKNDDEKLVRWYDSKALTEYAVGRLHSMRGDTAAARAAYGRALTEDLSFTEAHVALAELAVASRDLPAAEAEYQAAVQSRDADAFLHHQYALVLLGQGRSGEAGTELERAEKLEPYYAMPYYLLGRLYDAAGMEVEALAQYHAFLTRSSRMLDERRWVADREVALHAAVAAAKASAASGR